MAVHANYGVIWDNLVLLAIRVVHKRPPTKANRKLLLLRRRVLTLRR
jgi:hypothetical protein